MQESALDLGNDGDDEAMSTEGNENISIFERDPFKDFTQRKFKELLRKDNMENLIKMREQALDFRHKNQIEKLNRMLQNKRVSPRSFQSKRSALESWITSEKEQIKLSKKALERGWDFFNDTIKKV